MPVRMNQCRGRSIRGLLAGCVLASVAWCASAGMCLAERVPSISPADSQLILRQFGRIRRSSSLTVFQVNGYVPKCVPSTFPKPGVIDCHPIIQEIAAPSAAWRDSIVELLTAPGATVMPRAKLCACSDDVVLRFASREETTTVWLCTYCGTIGIPTGGGSVMGFDFDRGWESFRRLVYAVLPKLDYESLAEVKYYEDPPRLVSAPEVPPWLRVRESAPVDTVVFEVRIGRDGRVSELKLQRGVPGLDSLAADYVSHYRYKPALSRNHPVGVRWVISLQVPKSLH